MKRVILASSNQSKFKEISHALSGHVNLCLQTEFDVDDVEETGSTFIENALLKARNACQYTDMPAIADDSGLVVDALNGAPGLYTARYAGKGASCAENISKLLDNLKDIPEHKRDAFFYCAIVYLRYPDDPIPEVFEAKWHGKILFEPQGSKGFAYDPVFWVPSQSCSAAELDLGVKNQISHRGQAINLLKNFILSD